MDVADLNHCGTRFDATLVVFAVATTTTVPRICAFDNPPLLQRRESSRSLRATLNLDAPIRTFCLQPSFQPVIMILVIAENDRQSRKVRRRDSAKEDRRGNAVIERSARNQHGHQQSQRIDQQMSLTALDFLASVVTPFLTADFGGFYRLAVDAHCTGRGLAAFLGANLDSQGIDEMGP